MGVLIALGLIVTAAVLGVFGFANPSLCLVSLILAIVGLLVGARANRERQRREADARNQALVDAFQRGQPPPRT